MNLTLLYSSPQVAVYFDFCNNWLYVGWEREIALSVVKQVARCLLAELYAQVLTDNCNVAGVALDVRAWLCHHCIAYRFLAGAKHLAWVCPPTQAGFSFVPQVLSWFPRLEATAVMDWDAAVRWLQQGQLPLDPAPARTPATQVKLTQVAVGIAELAALT